jgi:hypothetical protein
LKKKASAAPAPTYTPLERKSKQAAPTFDSDRNMRRLNVNLPPNVYEDLQRLAKQSNRSLTDIVRTGLGLAQIALHETADGQHKLAVTDRDGKAVKEIVLLR